MALVERLMGLAPDGVNPAPSDDPAQAKIPVHLFFAAQQEVIEGQITMQAVKNYLLMNDEAIAEYDALAAQAPTGTTALATAQKAMFLNRLHAVFILAEARVSGYHTPAAVRAKLGLS